MNLTPYPKSDGTLAYDDAVKFARAVEEWWHTRGFLTVAAWPEHGKPTGGYAVWEVKSNLKNGMAQGATAQLVSGWLRSLQHGRAQ